MRNYRNYQPHPVIAPGPSITSTVTWWRFQLQPAVRQQFSSRPFSFITGCKSPQMPDLNELAEKKWDRKCSLESESFLSHIISAADFPHLPRLIPNLPSLWNLDLSILQSAAAMGTLGPKRPNTFLKLNVTEMRVKPYLYCSSQTTESPSFAGLKHMPACCLGLQMEELHRSISTRLHEHHRHELQLRLNLSLFILPFLKSQKRQVFWPPGLRWAEPYFNLLICIFHLSEL
jgi:hypothetical protein